MGINEKVSRNRLLIAIIATHWLLGFIFWEWVINEFEVRGMGYIYGLLATAINLWGLLRHNAFAFSRQRLLSFCFGTTAALVVVCFVVLSLRFWSAGFNLEYSSLPSLLLQGLLSSAVMLGYLLVEGLPFIAIVGGVNYLWVQYFKSKTK